MKTTPRVLPFLFAATLLRAEPTIKVSEVTEQGQSSYRIETLSAT